MCRDVQPNLYGVRYEKAVVYHRGAKDGFLIGRDSNINVGTAIGILKG
jgi:hypothetical protein